METIGGPDWMLAIGNIKNMTEIYEKKFELKPLFGYWVGQFEYIHNTGTQFYFMTGFNAPMKRVVVIDIDNYAKKDEAGRAAAMQEVIPQHESHVLQMCKSVHQKMVCQYM